MSSESDLSVLGGQESESECSDDDDYVSPPPRSRKNSDQPSSSGVPLKKRRHKSPVEEPKEWGKPDLSHLCVGGLALFNMNNETGSTKEIREFIIEQFPYYSKLSSVKWSNYFKHITTRVGITKTGRKDDRRNILTLDSYSCGSLKKKLENKLTRKMDSIKLTMANPENFDLFLQNVRDYICTTDESTDLNPKLSVCQLLHDLFGENFEIEMTVPEMATKIADKYEYYDHQDRKTTLRTSIRANIGTKVLFIKCGQREGMTLWKLDASQTGLGHPSRIPTVPKPVQKLISNSETLFLLGNSSGKVANFYFQGHDPKEIVNKKSRNKIDVTTEGPPGRFKSYISWMTCLDPLTCPFSKDGEPCFNFIFGNSDQSFSTITQGGISLAVNREYVKRKALLPNFNIPNRPLDLSDDEESDLADFDGQGEDSDPSDDDDEPSDKLIDSEPDKKNDEEPKESCKGPLDFLLQYPNHEVRKENCLTLWTTNNNKLKRPLKNFPRGAYKDISKAKGMYPQMTPEAYAVFDSLRMALSFRKKYIIRAQKEGRLLDLPTPQQLASNKNYNIQISQEEYEKLGNERRLSTVSPKGETVIITIK